MASDIKKFINGSLVCNNRAEVIKQLADVKSIAGEFNIQCQNTIENTGKRESSLRYQLSSKTMGEFITIAILKFDEAQKLQEIDEIYHQINPAN